MLRVNLKSMFLMSKYVLPEMIRRRAGPDALPGRRPRPRKLRATCVCPGAIDTPMLRWSASLDPDPERVLKTCERAHALERLGQPDEGGPAGCLPGR